MACHSRLWSCLGHQGPQAPLIEAARCVAGEIATMGHGQPQNIFPSLVSIKNKENEKKRRKKKEKKKKEKKKRK